MSYILIGYCSSLDLQVLAFISSLLLWFLSDYCEFLALHLLTIEDDACAFQRSISISEYPPVLDFC